MFLYIKFRSNKELIAVNSHVCFIPFVQHVDHGLKAMLDTAFLSKQQWKNAT